MSKYRAVSTIYGGVRYDSQGEARAAQMLDLLVQAGEVLWWERQIPFYLPWNSRYTVDFMVCFSGCPNQVCFIEYKGVETREAKERRKTLEWFLGEPIVVWHKEDIWVSILMATPKKEV